jgi:membrane protease YdiL (CAAX protease family)
MNILARFIKLVIEAVVLIAFIYLMTVINLYKSTGKIDWNIFKSEALPQFLIFSLIALPIIITVEFLWNRRKKKNVQIEDSKGSVN